MIVIQGFSVPTLIGFSDDFMAIEMSIVQPPRILDFGKATIDHAPELSQETMAYWHEQQIDLWGNQWPKIQRLLAELRTIVIYYSDPNPYNIAPENWDPDL